MGGHKKLGSDDESDSDHSETPGGKKAAGDEDAVNPKTAAEELAEMIRRGF
jgi:hypothetical protein